MNKNVLTKKEMEILSGGTFTDLAQINFINSLELAAKDTNVNKVKDCRCGYCNLGTTNSNKATGCACVCI